MFKYFVILSLLFASTESVFASSRTNALTCQDGYVERAGVALVKYYPNTQNPDLAYGVIVGSDAGKKASGNIPYVNFFAGKCETKDKYSTTVAVRELEEETGGAIKLGPHQLRRGTGDSHYYGYVYSGDHAQTNTHGKNYIQLFFWRDDQVSAAQISQAQKAAIQNPSLPRCWKEADNSYVIPLKDLLQRARTIKGLESSGQHNEAKKDVYYVFETRGDGTGANRTKVYLDPQYMRNLARDLTRFEDMCRRISNGQVT